MLTDTKKRICDFEVLRNTRLNPRHFLLTLKSHEPLPLILPGQFVQVLIENSRSAFLRRPFSVNSLHEQENTLKLLIQIKGEGTRKLSTIHKGDQLNLILPLGNSFTLPLANDVLLVGGGCGVAPLLFLGQYLYENGIQPVFLIGARSKKDLLCVEEYRKYGDVLITTEDGSEGEKGLVTDHTIFNERPVLYKKIYCCGPDPMMKKISRIAIQLEVDCEVSLENSMACGFGVCLCCITSTVHGNQRVCVEGPVFNTRELNWL